MFNILIYYSKFFFFYIKETSSVLSFQPTLAADGELLKGSPKTRARQWDVWV